MSKFLLLFLSVLHISVAAFLSEITKDIFDKSSGYVFAAFGDFNADRQTDIFVLFNDSLELGIFQQHEKKVELTYKKLFSIDTADVLITGVMPADFDGDVQMDLLVTLAERSADLNAAVKVNARIYWGDNKHIDVSKNYTTIASPLKDQPLIFDWNGDMVPDILAEKSSGEKIVFSAKDRQIEETVWDQGSSTTFRYPNSNAFLDLNDDNIADTFIANGDTKLPSFEFWLNVKGDFTKNGTLQLPNSLHAVLVGTPSFCDFYERALPSMLLPVCEDAQCQNSSIWVYEEKNQGDQSNQWSKVTSSFQNGDRTYSFVLPTDNLAAISLHQFLPIQLHIGDFNIDGFPDVLTVMTRDDDEQYAVLLFNEACDSCPSGRKLAPQWNTALGDHNNVIMAAFFDIHEDGVLDILTVTMLKGVPSLNAFANEFSADACFVKINVVSGLCNNECKDGREPYGVNQPGPTIKYETKKSLQTSQTGRAFLLSQSAHFSTQLPYAIFGLGQTPNFVDSLTVGIPSPALKHGDDKRERTWTQIIPNSQLIVIPFPHDNPEKWTLKLFVTPSHAILTTGISLLVSCVLCALIVGALQLLERHEDVKEKQQESQKFHFDAM